MSPPLRPLPLSAVSRGMASRYEMGKEGMRGTEEAGVRVTLRYAGILGVVGSPGYFESYWSALAW